MSGTFFMFENCALCTVHNICTEPLHEQQQHPSSLSGELSNLKYDFHKDIDEGQCHLRKMFKTIIQLSQGSIQPAVHKIRTRLGRVSPRSITF